MTGRPRERIITGGQVWATTAALAEVLAAGEPGRPPPGVIVWDERDLSQRWQQRPGTFVVRERWLRTWPARHGLAGAGARAADLELRADLWRHRSADLAFVGHVALRAAPWLRTHRGVRVWLTTPDDLPALDDGVAIPPVAAGGPHAIVADDLRVRRHPRLASDPRLRWFPGLRWVDRPRVAPTDVLALGAPDRRNGIDLVGRVLAHRAAELRSLGIRVRWIGPPEGAIAAEAAEDLIRSGVDDLISVEQHPDHGVVLRAAMAEPSTGAILCCGRPGALRPEDADLVAAYRAGIEVIAFGDGPPDDLQLDGRWTVPAFGDVTAAAEALVGSLRRPVDQRVPGPVGLSTLIAEAVSHG
jgi:hypothetical protein